ncbi:MAG: 16S rRNA (adenine(1518)-N(6)/adenine(1519)-N(6))-dimethyltransferase RsmA [Parcubacteria group bacterium]
MQPKKSLGQNFLRDDEVLEEIIRAAGLTPADNVLEIGPGEGVLTKKMVEKAGKVICVEKDDVLAKELKLIYKNNTTAEIINADIMEINLPELIKKNNFQVYKIIANIPYYITSPIIRLFLETKYPPQEMLLMVQREVAERICASAGQMSILSVSVQYYATPKILFHVDRKSFWPVPAVDSAVIRIVPAGKNPDKKEIDNFFRTVKAGFGAKRKTLSNNLSASLRLDKKIIGEKLKTANLAPTIRAQELSIKDWKDLSQKINA